VPKHLPESVYDFIKQIHSLSAVERRIILASGRSENVAEHSWHLAMMAWLLAPYYERKLDSEKILKLALMHDLVEIIAGDTFAFGDRIGQKEREDEAAEQLFAQLPRQQREEFSKLWEEYKEDKTKEARFVRALDKLQPGITNILYRGRGWKQFKVSKDMAKVHKKFIESRGPMLKEAVARVWNQAIQEKLFWEES